MVPPVRPLKTNASHFIFDCRIGRIIDIFFVAASVFTLGGARLMMLLFVISITPTASIAFDVPPSTKPIPDVPLAVTMAATALASAVDRMAV